MDILQRLMAHAFAGCLVAAVGAFAGGLMAFLVAHLTNVPPPDAPSYDWMQHGTYWLGTSARTVVYVVSGVLLGGVAGFGAGTLANVWLAQRHAARRPEGK